MAEIEGSSSNREIPALKSTQSKQMEGTEVRKVGCHEGSLKQGHKEAMGGHILSPLSGSPDKCQIKPKATKRKSFQPETPESVDGTNSTANGCRYDSSLGLLTRKFLNLLQQAEDGTLDLNRAADVLDVQKRRIYDITNVLEGVGLIEKKLKNMIRWKGDDTSRQKEMNNQLSGLKDEIETLYSDESRLDEMIREMQESLTVMSEDERIHKWLFVTSEDINNALYSEDTFIAILAPHGTSVEVPDPAEGPDFPQRRYRILLRSSMGPINCYLLSKNEGKLRALDSMRRAATVDHPPEITQNYIRHETPQPQSLSRSTTTMTNEQRYDKNDNDSSPDSFSSQDSLGSIVKIVPSDADMDADYFLCSESGVSITDTWMAE